MKKHNINELLPNEYIQLLKSKKNTTIDDNGICFTCPHHSTPASISLPNLRYICSGCNCGLWEAIRNYIGLSLNICDIMDSQLVFDYNNKDRYVFYNPTKLTVRIMDKDVVAKAVGYYIYSELNSHSLSKHFIYSPTKPQFFSDGGLDYFNTYVPPEWKKQHHYNNQPIPFMSWADVPECYKLFFEHLAGEHKDSLEYMLDWIATSLKGRNTTFLCHLGEQGIGKGTLSNILGLLHGLENSCLSASKDTLVSQFNGETDGKTFIYFPELEIDAKEKTVINNLKQYGDDYRPIQYKGKDKKNIINHSNVYISSNELTSLPVTGADRRYSILGNTEESITDRSDISFDDLKNPANIKSLAYYFWHRQCTNDMLKPFIDASKHNEMLYDQLKDWEQTIKDGWYAAQIDMGLTSAPLKEAQDYLKLATGTETPPGRGKFKDLGRRSGLWTLKQKKSDNSWYLQFKVGGK